MLPEITLPESSAGLVFQAAMPTPPHEKHGVCSTPFGSDHTVWHFRQYIRLGYARTQSLLVAGVPKGIMLSAL